MGQKDVLEFLEKSKNKNKWFTAMEISKKLNLLYSTVSINVRKLRQYKVVNVEKRIKYRNNNKSSPAEVWVYKHKKYKK